jgi:hypothetical protein
LSNSQLQSAASRDNVAIFFRRRRQPFEPAVQWVLAADIDTTYEELRRVLAEEHQVIS